MRQKIARWAKVAAWIVAVIVGIRLLFEAFSFGIRIVSERPIEGIVAILVLSVAVFLVVLFFVGCLTQKALKDGGEGPSL